MEEKLLKQEDIAVLDACFRNKLSLKRDPETDFDSKIMERVWSKLNRELAYQEIEIYRRRIFYIKWLAIFFTVLSVLLFIALISYSTVIMGNNPSL